MTETPLAQLQLLQQNLQHLFLQRQQFQKQLVEIDSALGELETSPQAYKIIGNLMVASKKPDLEKELQEKKELLSLRIKNFEKQEQNLTQKIEEIQQKVLDALKKKK